MLLTLFQFSMHSIHIINFLHASFMSPVFGFGAYLLLSSAKKVTHHGKNMPLKELFVSSVPLSEI